MTPVNELALLLRPAGGGLFVVSTGKAEQEALQRQLYHARSDEEVRARFRENLDKIRDARGIVLGVPSDVGAGFLRGANKGPQGIRTAYLEGAPSWPEGVVNIGDVFVVPQILHDSMLSDGQIAATRKAIYPGGETLPVSPLSITERALDLVFQLNPRVKPFVLGGDHSVAWAVTAALHRSRPPGWGIVQPDAHTDLLAERLGVKYCFATWSYHANELLGRGGRLVQVGIRATRHERGHWEQTLDVRQFWAAECRARPAAVLDELIGHLRERGVTGVYFSNDIDGTDAAYADATGTPEPDGLEPDFVVELIRRLGKEIGIIAGDVMEVAPPLAPTSGTSRLAARYLRETLAAALP